MAREGRTAGCKAEEDPAAARRLAEKVAAAQAVGVWEKVQAVGWGGLSAAESGRVGGEMTRRARDAARRASGPP